MKIKPFLLSQDGFVFTMTMLFCVFIGLYIVSPETQNNVFFHRTKDYMADFYNPAYSYSLQPNPYKSSFRREETSYPPLAFLLLRVAGNAGAQTETSKAAIAHLCMALMFLLFFAVLQSGFIKAGGKPVKSSFLVFSLFLSGIFLFSFERGNIVVLSSLLSAFFIFNYNSENKISRELALIALAVAAGLKLTPALLGVLLLFEKRYWQALRAAVYGMLCFFVPFLFFEGGLKNVFEMAANLKLMAAQYGDLNFPRFGFRYFVNFMNDSDLKHTLSGIFSLIDVILAISAVAACYFQKSDWIRAMLLLLVIATIPSNSAFYTGLYLFAGIVLFFSQKDFDKSRYKWFIILFIFLLNPIQIGRDVSVGLSNLSAYIMLIFLTAGTLAQFVAPKKMVNERNSTTEAYMK